jgi:glycosyltransferase involved in cell wall biosynthesis
MIPAPLVSVVMPVHNGGRLLQQAIDSILTQTVCDLELIVVDDGSSDATPELLRNRAESDHRIRVVQHSTNLGFAAALNNGFAQARGRFIARMDADDVALPSRFERQLSFLDDHPDVAIVGSAVRRLSETGVLGQVQQYPLRPGVVAWSMLFFNPIAHPTAMMRADAVDSPPYGNEYPGSEDYDFFFRLSRRVRIANIPEVLLHYRVWTGNMSRLPAQQQSAARVVQAGLRTRGIEVTLEQAAALQGLSRDRYPSDAAELHALGEVIRKAYAAYSREFTRPDDHAAIARDAGVRLWLLAALASWRSLPISLTLGCSAARIRPTSVFPFAAKALSRAAKGVSERLITRSKRSL